MPRLPKPRAESVAGSQHFSAAVGNVGVDWRAAPVGRVGPLPLRWNLHSSDTIMRYQSRTRRQSSRERRAPAEAGASSSPSRSATPASRGPPCCSAAPGPVRGWGELLAAAVGSADSREPPCRSTAPGPVRGWAALLAAAVGSADSREPQCRPAAPGPVRGWGGLLAAAVGSVGASCTHIASPQRCLCPAAATRLPATHASSRGPPQSSAGTMALWARLAPLISRLEPHRVTLFRLTEHCSRWSPNLARFRVQDSAPTAEC